MSQGSFLLVLLSSAWSQSCHLPQKCIRHNIRAFFLRCGCLKKHVSLVLKPTKSNKLFNYRKVDNDLTNDQKRLWSNHTSASKNVVFPTNDKLTLKDPQFIFPKAIWKGKSAHLRCSRSLHPVRRARLLHPSMSSRAFSYTAPPKQEGDKTTPKLASWAKLDVLPSGWLCRHRIILREHNTLRLSSLYLFTK